MNQLKKERKNRENTEEISNKIPFFRKMLIKKEIGLERGIVLRI